MREYPTIPALSVERVGDGIVGDLRSVRGEDLVGLAPEQDSIQREERVDHELSHRGSLLGTDLGYEYARNDLATMPRPPARSPSITRVSKSEVGAKNMCRLAMIPARMTSAPTAVRSQPPTLRPS